MEILLIFAFSLLAALVYAGEIYDRYRALYPTPVQTMPRVIPDDNNQMIAVRSFASEL